jgi:hypothetical protein
MRTRKLPCLVLVALLAQPIVSFAQATSTDADCEVINRSARTGRDVANSRIGQTERTSNEQISARRKCLEAFGDMAGRQAIVIGGYDLTPLRKAFLDQACGAIESKVKDVTMSTTSNLPNALPSIPPVPASTPGINPGAAQSPAPAQQKSVFDRLTCSFSGSC